ncbi:MAG: hypothetical protein ACSHWY_03030 [Octadecabacter sp.]
MTIDKKIQAYTHCRLCKEERAAFEREMAKNPALRAEVIAITAVQTSMAQGADDLPEHGWDRLSDSIDAQEPAAANDNRPVRFSLLQAVGIAVVTAFGWQVIGATILSNGPAFYTTVSVANGDPLLQVVFSSTALLSDVTETLVELDGRIVDGPSVFGLYAVAFADTSARDAAFAALSERPDFISEVTAN